MIAGFCLPKGAENYEPTQFLNFKGKWGESRDGGEVVCANDLDQLKEDSSGLNCFLDQKTRWKQKLGLKNVKIPALTLISDHLLQDHVHQIH